MNITIRHEQPTDYRAVEELTREAFWGFTSPTCEEHYLVHTLRTSTSFLPELDFVAEIDGRLIGNVMYSKAKIIDLSGTETEVLTFGPLSVLPEYWNCGVGSALMRHSITEAKLLGFRAIVFYGHPDYYPRFGFQNAKAFGITSVSGQNFDALMAMELYDGALSGVSGAFHEDPLFQINGEEAEAYNLNFPHKEPALMIPVDILLKKLKPAAREGIVKQKFTTLARLNNVSGREILTWDGIEENTLEIINQTLCEYGYSPKLFPTSPILQLAEMGLRLPNIDKIRSKAGISVYQVESEGKNYILKIFVEQEDRREIENYKLLASLGIPTLSMLKHTGCALLLPDINYDEKYRLGCAEDLSDLRVAAAIARWYKILHQKGSEYLTEVRPGFYDELDLITPANLARVAETTETSKNELWSVIHKHFAEMRQRIDALLPTLAYNDFYWTNLVVARDGSASMMLDFNLLGTGYAFGDIRNVTSSLSEEAKEVFLSEYGEETINEEERVADAFLSPLVTLIVACEREAFPTWAASSLEELKQGTLLENLHRWLGMITTS